MITALLIGAGAWLLLRKHAERGTQGVGAAKRRIFKELSLAQQLGVDFEKKYDELSEEEIEALQRVSADTGYTETYYKSLQKAYNAISGIGETYDVVNADGETVLTWTDDPGSMRVLPGADDPERWRALREAHDIEDDRIWDIENKKRLAEEKDRELRKRRNASKRLQQKIDRDGLLSVMPKQQTLFGVGSVRTEDVLEPELLEYIGARLDSRQVSLALDEIDETRSSLSYADPDLVDQIHDLVENWCMDNAVDPDGIWSVVDEEDIFWAL